MARQLLIDNDALLKLAQYGLLDAVVEAFGSSLHDVRVLATAKYSLLPAKNRLLRCKDEDSANRLEDFLKRSAPLDMVDADPALLDALNAVPSIDAGEALLLAAGASDWETQVIIGDKRALAALSADPAVSHVANALAGRVVTLEVVFWQLVEQRFAHTQLCVRSKPDVDKALSNVFGVSAPATMDSVLEGLASYIEHLRGLTGALLRAPSG
jgi:hypothetical protein